MSLNFKTLFLLMALMLSSCGQLTGESTGANDGIIDNLIGGLPALELRNGKTLLRGEMNFQKGHSFLMRFDLPEGETLKYFFFADKNLENGVEATFSRTGGKTFLALKINSTNDIPRELAGVGEKVEVVIDIHNNESDAHVILWNEGSSYNGDDECVLNGTCLYSTGWYVDDEVPGAPWGDQGQTSGTFWGFRGKKSLIDYHEGPSDVKAPH